MNDDLLKAFSRLKALLRVVAGRLASSQTGHSYPMINGMISSHKFDPFVSLQLRMCNDELSGNLPRTLSNPLAPVASGPRGRRRAAEIGAHQRRQARRRGLMAVCSRFENGVVFAIDPLDMALGVGYADALLARGAALNPWSGSR